MSDIDVKKYRVIIDPAAYEAMFHHFLFLAQVDEDAAKGLELDMYNQMIGLEYMPHRFPYYENRYVVPRTYRAMVVGKYHKVIYRVDDDSVYIDNIIDCREDS